MIPDTVFIVAGVLPLVIFVVRACYHLRPAVVLPASASARASSTIPARAGAVVSDR